MTIRSISVLLLIIIAGLLAGCKSTPKKNPELAVLIVVDQFRADLLTRYDQYLDGGFRKIKDEGFQFTNAYHNYAITNSAAGYATIHTGQFPRHHGVMDNFWLKPNDDWAVELNDWDTTVVRLGEPDARFGISPQTRLSTGLLDWVKDANPEAHVYSFAQGSTPATGLAPKKGGESYWSSGASLGYVTSSYYRADYPDWVLNFNENILPTMVDTVWDLSVPEEALTLARRDDANYENRGQYFTFPHTAHRELSAEELKNTTAIFNWYRSTPAIDRATLKLAQEAIIANNLSTNQVLDMININIASLDDIGHSFGPLSLEQFDALLKVDQALGDFLEFLDEKVGRENYTLAITGDHGSIITPEYNQELYGEGRRIPTQEIEDLVSEVHAIEFEKGATLAEKGAIVKPIVLQRNFIADVYTFDQLKSNEPTTDEYLKLYRNSFREDRVPMFPVFWRSPLTSLAEFGLMARIKKHMMPDYATAIHGSPYEYDRHVPLLFYGANIKRGSSSQKISTVDIAPTLASLLGFKAPENIDGKPLKLD